MIKSTLTSLLLLIGTWAMAQATRSIPADTMIVTTHQASIKGKKVPYKATTGFQPVWNEDGHPIASLFYTFYERTDVSNKDRRPLIISFNGGPGSASVWMHLAYTGPKILNIDNEGFPIQPYGVKDNPHSILDVADIVFVNPANTGYSRTIPASGKEVERSHFFS